VSSFRLFYIAVPVAILALLGLTCTAQAGGDTPADAAAVVPDHDISYAAKTTLPRWKTDWDQARALYRKGKIGQALVQYELLLQKKSSIDEARWEYAAILMQEKRWRQAGEELDTLIAHNPGSRKYIFARAGVALHEGRFAQAVKQFGALYESCPDGPDAVKALTGLIDALDLQGNREAELPLLELLLLRKPGDPALLQRTGSIALALGKPDKTRTLLAKAITDYPDNANLLKLLARAESQLKNREKAAGYWQRFVALVPDDIQANAWLAGYYLQKGNLAMALRHTERQLKVDPINVDLLLRAARLHKKIGQPGKSLDFFSLYLELVPDDQGVVRERDRLRKELAVNLVTLVQGNNRSRIDRLWQDVGTMTNDRNGVFVQMADWFRTHGKKAELTAILLLLHRQHPADKSINRELVPLLEAAGRMDELSDKPAPDDQDKTEGSHKK